MYVWQSLKTKMITGCWFHVQWRDGTYLHHSSLRHDRNTDSSKNSGQRKTGNNGWSTGHKIARFAKLFHKSFKIGKKTFYSTFKEGQRHPPSWEARVSRQQSKTEMEEVPWKTEPEKKTSIYVSPSSGSQICYRFGFQQMSIRIEEEEDSSSKAHLK